MLTVSGYAREECTKDVAVSVSFGECSDTKIFTFQVMKDGRAVAISNSSLGDWGIGIASSVTLTTKTTGSVSGTVRYYSTSKPSWMSLNASTGVLSGTATGSAGSGSVSVYVIKGNYRSPTKSLSYRTVNTLPQWKYSEINIDLTTMERTTLITTYDFKLTGLYTNATATPTINTEQIIKPTNGSYYLSTSISIWGSTYYLHLEKLIKSKLAKGEAFLASSIITVTNVYGSASITVNYYVATKAKFESNYSQTDPTPIVTYS